MKELGVEEELRRESIYKPGATFTLGPDTQISFRFDEVRAAHTTYSYNVPRDRFDAALLGAARSAGVRVVPKPAKLELGDGPYEVQLSVDSLADTEGFFREPPDLIVDASGRSRVLPRLLNLPVTHGDRRDTALFSHLEGIPLVVEGNVHTDLLERGWSWRIPLPGRVSVGLVVPDEHRRRFGATAEEQFDGLLASDACVARWGATPRRVAPVMKYTDYQQIGDRCVGPGWALVGDCFGFIDPVFSSGLLVGLDGSRRLARAILSGKDKALPRYEREVRRHLQAWQRVVNHFYNGRLMTLFQTGQEYREMWFGRMLDFHFRKHLPRVFTGEATMNRYSIALTDFMCRYALARNDPDTFRVR